VYTDANGNASVFFTTSTALSGGTVTATATDSAGNTSQFSAPATVTLHPFNTANGNFVFQVYLDLLHRPADAGGQQFFANALNTGASRASVVSALQNTAEYRNLEVTDLYNRLLKRAPDAGGLAAFTAQLAQGSTMEQIEAAFIGSAEYYKASGSTTNGFLAAAYGDLLGRQPDAGGLTFFGNQLAMAVSRATVATELVSGSEGAQKTVDRLFEQLLHRAADAGAKTYFGTQLQDDMRDEQLVAVLAASDEYFANVS
jgi:hypothetical protein